MTETLDLSRAIVNTQVRVDLSGTENRGGVTLQPGPHVAAADDARLDTSLSVESDVE